MTSSCAQTDSSVDEPTDCNRGADPCNRPTTSIEMHLNSVPIVARRRRRFDLHTGKLSRVLEQFNFHGVIGLPDGCPLGRVTQPISATMEYRQRILPDGRNALRVELQTFLTVVRDRYARYDADHPSPNTDPDLLDPANQLHLVFVGQIEADPSQEADFRAQLAGVFASSAPQAS